MRDKDSILLEEAYSKVTNEDYEDVSWGDLSEYSHWDKFLIPYIKELKRLKRRSFEQKKVRADFLNRIKELKNLLDSKKNEEAINLASEINHDWSVRFKTNANGLMPIFHRNDHNRKNIVDGIKEELSKNKI